MKKSQQSGIEHLLATPKFFVRTRVNIGNISFAYTGVPRQLSSILFSHVSDFSCDGLQTYLSHYDFDLYLSHYQFVLLSHDQVAREVKAGDTLCWKDSENGTKLAEIRWADLR